MTISKILQEKRINYLSDHKNHTVKDMKDYLDKQNLQYSEGHFSGSVHTLVKNGSITRIDRGVYAAIDKEQHNEEILPLLHKILDEIELLKSEVKSVNSQMIETIIRSLRS